MGIWDGRDHHDVHVLILHHLLCGPVAFDAWMVFLGIIIRLGIPLYHGIELQFRDLFDEGDVKDFGGHAIAYDTDVVGIGAHRADWLLRSLEVWIGSFIKRVRGLSARI